MCISMMAASRVSRIDGRQLASQTPPQTLLLLLLLLLGTVLSVAPASSHVTTSERIQDAESISVLRPGSEYIAFSGTDGDSDNAFSTSPFDLKKHNSNKKFVKFFPKTEADWNFKGEGRKSDVFIKDPIDSRLLRIVSESVSSPRDSLPMVAKHTITSSHKSVINKEMSVTVQPEGMSGMVYDELTADSDEKIIMEKKKNVTKVRSFTRFENDASKESSDEDEKINLDANVGVQSPVFDTQKGSIAVPAQKHITLSKGKEGHVHKKITDLGYDVISLTKNNRQQQKQRQQPAGNADEGIFDFVDSPLSSKNLVAAGTDQTSRINVKKGPNGQDYEYEYIYYYYEDGEEGAANNKAKSKANDIISGDGVTSTTRVTAARASSTPSTRYTKPWTDKGPDTRIKSSTLAPNQAVSHQYHHNRGHRPEFRYNADHSVPLASDTASSKPTVSNDVYWHYENTNNNRFPGRQIPLQAISEQPITTVENTLPTTRHSFIRGRVQYNTPTSTIDDDSSYIVTAQPISTQPPRESGTKGKTTGSIRQPGLELVDSNSFRTHSTNIPTNYEGTYYLNQFETSSGKSPLNDIPASQNLPAINIKGDFSKMREQTIEHVTDTEHVPQTTVSRVHSQLTSQTEPDNTVPHFVQSENSLTTVYGAGLTDKAAHDLYAIYQQTQNEEFVKNTLTHEDHTTLIDDTYNPFLQTNLPTQTFYTTITTTSSTSTTTTTTETPTTTTSTTTASIQSSHVPGRGRFRGNGVSRSRHPSASTEAASPSSDSAGENSEKPKTRFQPQRRREPGHKISGYGRRGSSTTPFTSESEPDSHTESSTRSSWHGATRSRFRASPSLKSENNIPETQSTSAPSSRPNFADRYSRRRPGMRSSTTSAPSLPSDGEEVSIKQDDDVSVSYAEPQQSTTFRSVRNKLNGPNSHVRPLRPGPRINLSSRGRFSVTSTTTVAAVPVDADTSGSADVPVERQRSEDTNGESEDAYSDTETSSTLSTTAASTTHPDALTRLKNRPKLRVTDKGGHAKAQAQQSTANANANQNRKQLVSNLLPRKKQPTTSTETQETKEEINDDLSKPATENAVEDASASFDAEVSDALPAAEVSSTTENKLNSLLASRRRNLNRRPQFPSKQQTTNEES